MEVLLRTVTEHAQSQGPGHSPAVSHSETNASLLARSPSMSQNRSRAASRLRVADTESERPQSAQDLQRTSSPGHGIGTVVHVASVGPQKAITAAYPDPAAFASSPSREHGAAADAADSPGFRNMITLASEDLELPSVVSEQPDMGCSSMSREPIATTARAPAYSTPAPTTIADVPAEGPERTHVAGKDNSWNRERTNIVTEQPMAPPSLAAGDENDKTLDLNADAPYDAVGLVGQATRTRLAMAHTPRRLISNLCYFENRMQVPK